MNNTIIILNSYNKNGLTLSGNYPVYVKGISQCCIDKNGKQVITPVYPIATAK
jgi:hypothetical protein